MTEKRDERVGDGRKRRAVHGWLVVDKPAGLTSAAVVSRVRRVTGAMKAGHGGTLDPLATGLLPLALGEATKTVSYIMDGMKTYRFTVRWGEQRNTDDAEGEITGTSHVRPDAGVIGDVLARFQGEIQQVPPIFSAIKVAGKRAYALARTDKPVDLAARTVFVKSFRLIECPDEDHAIFEVIAGKGVYMRALARDVALALGTVGHVVGLRRLTVGPFQEQQAIPLDKLEAIGHSPELMTYLLPVGLALADIPALVLTEAEARCLQHGQPIAVLPVACRSPLTEVARDTVVCAVAKGKPVALAQIKGGELHPLRILNL
jgi:tRNA pseudouridine55 synthase